MSLLEFECCKCLKRPISSVLLLSTESLSSPTGNCYTISYFTLWKDSDEWLPPLNAGLPSPFHCQLLDHFLLCLVERDSDGWLPLLNAPLTTFLLTTFHGGKTKLFDVTFKAEERLESICFFFKVFYFINALTSTNKQSAIFDGADPKFFLV